MVGVFKSVNLKLNYQVLCAKLDGLNKVYYYRKYNFNYGIKTIKASISSACIKYL